MKVRRNGQEVELPADLAEHLIRTGQAFPVRSVEVIETAVAPIPTLEHATIETTK
jgi:hypothetical protein